MVDHVLVDGRGGGNQNGHAGLLPPPRTAELLPGRRDRPWITGQDGHVELADVDAEL